MLGDNNATSLCSKNISTLHRWCLTVFSFRVESWVLTNIMWSWKIWHGLDFLTRLVLANIFPVGYLSEMHQKFQKNLGTEPSSIYSWSVGHILEHGFFCLGHLGSSGSKKKSGFELLWATFEGDFFNFLRLKRFNPGVV